MSDVQEVKFIRRRKIEKLVNDALNPSEQIGVEKKFIINLYGITGIGKSCVIQSLWDNYRTNGTSTMFINFSKGAESPDDTDRITLNELTQKLRLQPLFNQLDPNIVDADDKPINLQQEVVYGVTRQPEDDNTTAQPPQLVLLDGVDDSSYWRWIQRSIIKPLVEQQQTLIVVASQSPLFWHFWELRDTTNPIELEPFSVDEIKDYLHANPSWRRWEPFAEALHDYTKGYPFGLNQLLERVLSGQSSVEHVLVDVKKHAPDDVGKIDNVEELFTAETFEIIRHIGILRTLTYRLMLLLMTEVFGSQADNRKRLDKALFELRQKGYLNPMTRERPGLSIREDLRQALEQHLRQVDEEHYYRLCESLCAEYEAKINEEPGKYAPSFNQWLYFSLPLVRAGYRRGDSWKNRFDDLLTLVELGGVELEPLLTQDKVLLERIFEPDGEQDPIMHLPPKLQHTLLQRYLSILNLKNEYRRIVEKRINVALPQSILENYWDFLSHIPDPEGPFTMQQWRSKLNETRKKLPNINSIIPVLYSRSLINYDRREKTFLLNTVLQPVIPLLLLEDNTPEQQPASSRQSADTNK
ncbi:hypothetical protein HC928_07070 [bacterium]|nr:hypothetical protein [bacterium]